MFLPRTLVYALALTIAALCVAFSLPVYAQSKAPSQITQPVKHRSPWTPVLKASGASPVLPSTKPRS